MWTDPLRSAALGTFAVGLVLALSIGANAAEITFKCEVDYSERSGAQNVRPRLPVRGSAFFGVFDEGKKDFSILKENLLNMYSVIERKKKLVYVDKEKIFTSYRSEAFYMSDEQQKRYFNWLTISINRHDGSFSMRSSPYYETEVEGKLAWAGNINDDFEHAPSYSEVLEKWNSFAFGKCKVTEKAF